MPAREARSCSSASEVSLTRWPHRRPCRGQIGGSTRTVIDTAAARDCGASGEWTRRGRRPACGARAGAVSMTVLVDPPIWPRHGRLWGHLVSDTSLAELHDPVSYT